MEVEDIPVKMDVEDLQLELESCPSKEPVISLESCLTSCPVCQIGELKVVKRSSKTQMIIYTRYEITSIFFTRNFHFFWMNCINNVLHQGWDKVG